MKNQRFDDQVLPLFFNLCHNLSIDLDITLKGVTFYPVFHQLACLYL